MKKCPICGKELTVENFKRDWIFRRWRCQNCGTALRRKYTVASFVLLVLAGVLLGYSAVHKILIIPAIVLIIVNLIYSLTLPYVPHRDFLIIRTIFRGIKVVINKISGKTHNDEKESMPHLLAGTCPVCKNKLDKEASLLSRENFQTQCKVCKTKLKKNRWPQYLVSLFPVVWYFFNGRQINKTIIIVLIATVLAEVIVSRLIPYHPFDGFDFISVEEATEKWQSREAFWKKIEEEKEEDN